ncbi:antitoxin MazE family protein [Tsukamurella sp. PLM1]|uniref:antitoxin MazE family protein n=1 Tax=Tsukamurella sp. PLM1 TaxID=2929795 RepID=UPI003530229B
MSTRDRVRRHREGLRARGLRPLQIWVPDTRAPGFAEQAHRESALAASDPDTSAVHDFIDDVTDWETE